MEKQEDLYWHCLQCGAHEPVEPTTPEYKIGDWEQCIDCGDGAAHVVTLKMGGAYEQGRALGLGIADSWDRAMSLCSISDVSELEKEFIETRKKIEPLIEAKLEEAQKCINEAVKLSDEYGVPFNTCFTGVPNEYIPHSFKKYQIDIDSWEEQERWNIYPSYDEFYRTGWQHSY